MQIPRHAAMVEFKTSQQSEIVIADDVDNRTDGRVRMRPDAVE